jgi:type II secretory pathway pseudopilin PulG
MLNNLNIKNNKGFTLLEALVAISILMVAVVAPITIAQKGLSSSFYIKNQMIASYLAQDAIEYIKNKRDQAFIRSSVDDPKWDSLWGTGGTLEPCKGLNGCQVDTNTGSDGLGSITPYDSNAFLKKNDHGFYGYETGFDDTIFRRQIQIEKTDDQATITVTVSWGEDSVKVKTLIYNQ